MKIAFLPEAEQELSEAKDGYAAIDIQQALAFADEFDRIAAQLSDFPQSGSRRHRFRRCLFFGFPYAVIYKTFPNQLLVVAIVHTSRRPGYWRSRVTKK